ncbi:hypothetical protein POUND7_015387 [Theobroma cacao]
MLDFFSCFWFWNPGSGIPPVSKLLNNSDAQVTALCKKLATWWPWVRQIFAIGYATFMVIWMTL